MVSTLITVAVIARVRSWRWAAGRFPALIGLSINLANRGGSASGAPAGVLSPGGGCRGAGRTAAGDGHFIDERPYGIRQTG